MSQDEMGNIVREPARDQRAIQSLRLGVLLDAFAMPAWAAMAVKMAKQIDGVSIVAVLLVNRKPVKRSLWKKLWLHRKLLLYLLYSRVDKACFGGGVDPFENVDLTSVFHEVPVVDLNPAPSRIVDRFPESELSSIKALELDVVLNFDHRILRGGILDVARHGVWSLHHGDYERYRGGPPGFWEVMNREPVTGSMLQVLTEDLDNGRVLCQGHAATDPTSVARSKSGYFWKSASYFARELDKLRRGSAADANEASGKVSVYSRPIYRPPTNKQCFPQLLGHVARGIGRFGSNRMRIDQWRLACCWSDCLPSSMRLFKEISPPKGKFWADPHVVIREGRYFVFFEEYDYRRRKGHICVMEMTEGEGCGEVRVALDLSCHLSYPFVFEWDGEMYMIPESSERRTVDLYRSVEFPAKWEFSHSLMTDIEAVDATLHFDGSCWWMFAGVAEVPGASPWDELHLFSAESPVSTSWKAHPRNPVIPDVRRARPAGPLFRHEGRVYRPSQNCAPTYGYSLRLNEVLELNEATYREREATHIEPTWEPKQYGVHSWSRAGRLTVVDVKRRPWRMWA